MNANSIDPICRGELVLEQPVKGYRFNVDPIILADFVTRIIRPPVQRIVDLGAGCGILGLLIGKRWPGSHITLVEIQEALASLAYANVMRNNLAKQVNVLCSDLLELKWCRNFPQLVVSNPPFFEVKSGRVSSNIQIAVAKHELKCPLGSFLNACSEGMTNGGALVMIHDARRFSEIIDELYQHNLGCKTVRQVRPFPERPPRRVLIHAVKGAQADIMEQPALVIETSSGKYSDEMRRILRDDD